VRGEQLGTIDKKTDAQAAPMWTARLAFARLDADRNGFLEGTELETLRQERVDRDADERVSLAEYAANAGVLPESAFGGDARAYSGGRTGIDGDLARLFDGVDPAAFDKDADGKLGRADVERVLFAATDLDHDGRLSRAEASRLPGEPRQLRFGGARADALFRRLDGDDTRVLEAREVRLSDEDWYALDANRDGAVQLRAKRGARINRRGGEMDTIEWPYRTVAPTLLPPEITRERVLATFDTDKDGTLNKRELQRRPDLAFDLDADYDGVVRANEIDAQIATVDRFGTDSSPDAFLARWDLDGSGVVEEKELALPRVLLERVLGRP
jgi:Ca2+-binding EF-hand superfamily protein